MTTNSSNENGADAVAPAVDASENHPPTKQEQISMTDITAVTAAQEVVEDAAAEANENHPAPKQRMDSNMSVAKLTDAQILQIAADAGYNINTEDVGNIQRWIAAIPDEYEELEWMVRELAQMKHRFNVAVRPTVDSTVPPLPLFSEGDNEGWELDNDSGQLMRAWSREFGQTCWIALYETVDDDGEIVVGEPYIYVTDRAMWTSAEAAILRADVLAAMNALDGQ